MYAEGMHTLSPDNVAVFFQYMRCYIHVYTLPTLHGGMHTLW